MHEDGAAGIADHRVRVVIEHQGVPVERVGAEQFLEGGRLGLAAPHPAVVIRRLRVVHPEVLVPHLAIRDFRAEALGRPEGLADREDPGRGAAVPFPFFPRWSDAVSPHVDGDGRQGELPPEHGAPHGVESRAGGGGGAWIDIEELSAALGGGEGVQAFADAPRQVAAGGAPRGAAEGKERAKSG